MDTDSEAGNNPQETGFVLGLIRGMDTLAVLYSGIKLGVFEMIEDGCATAARMHERKGYDIRALSALLHALAALSLLEKKGNEFALCPFTQRLLKNRDAKNNIKLAHAYAHMFNYPARVRDKFYYQPTAEDWEDITDMGAASAGPLIDYLCRLVPALTHGDMRLLDVGCGQGHHLVELAGRNPAMRGIGIDNNEDLLAKARENLEKNGLTKRVELKKADMRTFDFGGGMDAVTIFTALRGMRFHQVKSIAARARQSLKPGGYLVIQDFFLEDNRTAPVENVIFDLRLVLSPGQGQVFPLSRYAELQDVGFETYTTHIIAGTAIPVKDSAYHIYRK